LKKFAKSFVNSSLDQRGNRKRLKIYDATKFPELTDGREYSEALQGELSSANNVMRGSEVVDMRCHHI
jgi:hypothetical protein